MALPTMASINTAVNDLFAAFSALKSREKSRAGVQSLNEVQEAVRAAYAADVNLTVTDATDATLAAFFASTGELGIAFAATQYPLEVGRVFSVNGAGDTTDNALQTAKGSAVAANDVFEITNTGTPAVVYLGTTTTLDFTDEEYADF